MLNLDPEQDAKSAPDNAKLKTVAALVNEWDTTVDDIKLAEAYVAGLRTRKAEIEQRELPAAMAEAGTSSFRALNGRQVEISTVCQGNIPAVTTIASTKDNDERQRLTARRLAAITYVGQHWPGLIKTELSLTLPKGEAQVALRVAELIRNQFQLNPSVAETIHPATLNSHFKELWEAGSIGKVPVDLFALYVGPFAKIK